MGTQSRNFPYEKSIVINALYDTIEALGLRLDSSNSARGTLIVSDAQQTERLRITLDAVDIKNQTRVSILPEKAEGAISDAWSIVILDELSGMMERARRCDKRNHLKEGDSL